MFWSFYRKWRRWKALPNGVTGFERQIHAVLPFRQRVSRVVSVLASYCFALFEPRRAPGPVRPPRQGRTQRLRAAFRLRGRGTLAAAGIPSWPDSRLDHGGHGGGAQRRHGPEPPHRRRLSTPATNAQRVWIITARCSPSAPKSRQVVAL